MSFLKPPQRASSSCSLTAEFVFWCRTVTYTTRSRMPQQSLARHRQPACSLNPQYMYSHSDTLQTVDICSKQRWSLHFSKHLSSASADLNRLQRPLVRNGFPYPLPLCVAPFRGRRHCFGDFRCACQRRVRILLQARRFSRQSSHGRLLKIFRSVG